MKQKHIWIFGMCLALLLGSMYLPEAAQAQTTEISFTIGSRDMNVNGKPMQAEPSYIDHGTTLVPLRVISEAFGAEVEWSEKTNSVSLRLEDCSILLMIGDKSCYVNGEEKTLPAAPALKNGSTMVPLRFISEAFGATVQFNEQAKTVLVYYTHTRSGTKYQLPAFGVRLMAPDDWKQKATSANRLLLEKRYSNGTVDFFYVLAAETGCTGEEWLKQESSFLKTQYGSAQFQSQSGTVSDENGRWTTLAATVSGPTWQTLLRERYLPGKDFGYFVRYGRLTPSPQESGSGGDVGQSFVSTTSLQVPGEQPAWEEMERILAALEIAPATAAQVQASAPHWNASQRIMNKYDGWQMNLPESFQTLSMAQGASLYEQQPDGIRLAVACALEKGSPIDFTNIIPFHVPLSNAAGTAAGKTITFKNYFDAFQSLTVDGLKQTNHYIHAELVPAAITQEKTWTGGTVDSVVGLCFQKDTLRYHTLNYFFSSPSGKDQVYFLGQILMPEETSNWLDMNRVYQSLKTFQYSR